MGSYSTPQTVDKLRFEQDATRAKEFLDYARFYVRNDWCIRPKQVRQYRLGTNTPDDLKLKESSYTNKEPVHFWVIYPRNIENVASCNIYC